MTSKHLACLGSQLGAFCSKAIVHCSFEFKLCYFVNLKLFSIYLGKRIIWAFMRNYFKMILPHNINNSQWKNQWPSRIWTWDLGITSTMLFQLSLWVSWGRAVDVLMCRFSVTVPSSKILSSMKLRRGFGNQFWIE